MPCPRVACYVLDTNGDGEWGSEDFVTLGQTCQEDSLIECVPTLPWTDSATGTLVYAFAEIGWDANGVACADVVSCDDRPLAYGSVEGLLEGQVATMDALAEEQDVDYGSGDVRSGAYGDIPFGVVEATRPYVDTAGIVHAGDDVAMLVQDYLRLFDADHNLRLVEGLARYGVLNLSSPAQAAAAAQYAAAVGDEEVEEELITWAESLSDDLSGNRCVAECTMYMREEPEKTEGISSMTSSLGGYVSPETPHEMYASSPGGWSDSGIDGPVAVFGNSRSKARADLTVACFFVDDGDGACEDLSCDLWGHNRVWMHLGSEADTASIFQPNAPAGGVKGTVSVGTFAVDDSEDSTGDGTFSMAVESQVGAGACTDFDPNNCYYGIGVAFPPQISLSGSCGPPTRLGNTYHVCHSGWYEAWGDVEVASEPASEDLADKQRVTITADQIYNGTEVEGHQGDGVYVRYGAKQLKPLRAEINAFARAYSTLIFDIDFDIEGDEDYWYGSSAMGRTAYASSTAIIDEIKPTDSEHRLGCYLSHGVVGDRWAAWTPADYEFGPSLPGDDVRAVFPVSDLSLGIFVDGIPLDDEIEEYVCWPPDTELVIPDEGDGLPSGDDCLGPAP